jgi:hypothetical protein
LLKRGWSPRSLLLARTIAGGEEHLVLVARTALGDFVLDNLAKEIVPVSQARLRWISIQSPSNPTAWRDAKLGRDWPIEPSPKPAPRPKNRDLIQMVAADGSAQPFLRGSVN